MVNRKKNFDTIKSLAEGIIRGFSINRVITIRQPVWSFILLTISVPKFGQDECMRTEYKKGRYQFWVKKAYNTERNGAVRNGTERNYT